MYGVLNCHDVAKHTESFHDPGWWKNIHQRDSRDPGDIPAKSRLYYSRDFVHDKALSQMGPQMSQCCRKLDRLLASQAILGPFRRNPVGFLNSLVTMDRTWIHMYDPETREQSKEWRHSGCMRPRCSRQVIEQGKGGFRLRNVTIVGFYYLTMTIVKTSTE
jgi:hypothetical protein